MHPSRRTFLGLMALAACAGATPRTAAAAARPRRQASAPGQTYFEWSLAAPGVHVAMGEGGNALLATTEAGLDGGALLVDCKNAPFGPVLRREAEAILAAGAAGAGAGALRWVINTHHHADHTGGNVAFIDPRVAGLEDAPAVTVMAHEKARERVLGQVSRFRQSTQGGLPVVNRSQRPQPARDAALADLQRAIALMADLDPADFAPRAGVEPIPGVRTEHFGAGHTDNDLVVRLEKANVLHTGDLVFNGLWPFVDLSAGATSAGWIDALRRARALCSDNTVVVPGHGPVGGPEVLDRQADVLSLLRDRAAAAVRAGTPREEFVRRAPDGAPNLGFEQIRPLTLGGLYDEARGGARP
jgi:glyoxylase-like metal-dependent hydrolase (beta-lactamase superfamily II)